MPRHYDAFISYHSRDQSQVQALAEKLRGQNLQVFLDRWYLLPGQPWPQMLEQTLSACGAVAVCIGPGELGPWQQRELYSALDRQAKETGFPVIPVLLPGAEPPLGFLRQNTWVDFRSGLSQDLPLRILAAAVRGEPPDTVLREHQLETLASVCPYKGLHYFREEDAEFFFGRDSAIVELYQSVQARQFIALVGPSGSGKSSVVRAGLVPKLRRETREPWEIVAMVPGDRPFHHLAAVLLPLLETDLGEIDRLRKTAELAGHLQVGTVQLRDVIERILAKQTGTRRFLLVVDQAEELYTHGENGKTPKQTVDFIKQILQASGSGPLTVVLTLRADFMGQVIGDGPLNDRLKGGLVTLGPMNGDELHQAVTQPAALLQVGFESGLTERIIKAVDGQPGHLPLVEFVLQRLWEAKPAATLRHQDYEAMGELEGAIAHTADDVYQRLTDSDKPKVETLFLQLVQVSESAAPTRRRALWTELDPSSRTIVHRLADARLLVTNQETVEVAHEALIRHWQTLQIWLNHGREFLLWRKRLQEAMEAWGKANRDGAALLSGARLKEAQRWLKQRNDLTGPERAFIQSGLHRRNQERFLAVGLAGLLLVFASFAGYVVNERITWRAGFYIWLAKAGIYYLQPEMVAIPDGSFKMGSLDSEKNSNIDEHPQHPVTVPSFQMGKYEVTFDEYDVFSHLIDNEGGCVDHHEIHKNVGDEGWGRGLQPVVNVSWQDAVCYAEWLSKHTGKKYRLPSEAEWEYAARAGTTTAYWWGDEIGKNHANCTGCGSEWDSKQTAPVGSFPANKFGLYDTAGNVWEWVEDCRHNNYQGAPPDGTVWQGGDCQRRVLRGGSWGNFQDVARCAYRVSDDPDSRNYHLGFRVVCCVSPPS